MSQEDMMGLPPLFTKQEYKIVIDENGRTSITDMDGVTVELQTATWIMRKLNAVIIVRKYLYVIMGGDNHVNEWKIGISANPHRRAKEVKGWVWNSIPLESTVCWDLEKYVHNTLARYRKTGEWFCFYDEIGRKLIRKLNDDIKTQDDLWDFVCSPEIHKLAKGSGN